MYENEKEANELKSECFQYKQNEQAMTVKKIIQNTKLYI